MTYTTLTAFDACRVLVGATSRALKFAWFAMLAVAIALTYSQWPPAESTAPPIESHIATPDEYRAMFVHPVKPLERYVEDCGGTTGTAKMSAEDWRQHRQRDVELSIDGTPVYRFCSLTVTIYCPPDCGPYKAAIESTTMIRRE